MKSQIFTLGTLIISAFISITAFGHEETTPTGPVVHEGPSLQIQASQIKYSGSGYAADGKEIAIFDAYGKFGNGPHGTFMKWPSGFKSPVHAHTYDYFGVVLKGKMANYAKGAKKIEPITAGSYWFQTGEQPHVTECLSKTPCEAFLVQIGGKFDAQFPDAK